MTKKELSAIAVTATLLVATFVLSLIPQDTPEPRELRPQIRAVMQLRELKKTTTGLIVGYNYYLLERYAERNGQELEISLAGKNGSWIDSLKAGKVDMVAVPLSDSLSLDSLIVSSHVDSLNVWLMRAEDDYDMEDFNAWLAEELASEGHKEIRDSYMKRYDVFRSRQRSTISPYDSIIKASADSVGMDWRLLAAIIYKESHFHIEARSRCGASGLMQMMPSTARSCGVTNALDPESNIREGSKYFGKLVRHYHNVGADRDERYKFALAAYNAGIGRIDEMLSLARLREKDTTRWEAVLEVLPEMQEENVLDTGVVKLGTFKGSETVDYVDAVMAIYREFCRICPE